MLSGVIGALLAAGLPAGRGRRGGGIRARPRRQPVGRRPRPRRRRPRRRRASSPTSAPPLASSANRKDSPCPTSRTRRPSIAPAYTGRLSTAPDPVAAAARRVDGTRCRIPVHPRRADARRQLAAEPRDVRHHLDGPAGREADGRDVRQEHDRQGRVPGHRGDRAALRVHGRRPVPRRGPARRRPVQRDRGVDDRVQRGGDARRAGAEVAVARTRREGLAGRAPRTW